METTINAMKTADKPLPKYLVVTPNSDQKETKLYKKVKRKEKKAI